MQSFDNGHYHSESTAKSRPMLPKKTLIILIACFVVLIIGLIIAIAFAIDGAVRRKESLSDSCSGSRTAAVWQEAACCRKECPKRWDPVPLLLISLDGFRYDYLKRNKTPTLKRLIDCGVHAPFMFPSYPTKTFPNHYSIVTGLHPESHGIIDNTMYDPNVTPPKDRLFRMDAPSAKNPQFWQGEPIWNTVMKNGMHAATYFWPGSEVPIQNMMPNYTLAYNKSTQFYPRVDQVIDWLAMPDETRPSFLTLYFDQPDTDGHSYGPDSEQISSTLVNVDAHINYLLNRLFDADLFHCINIVILADHGMQKVEQVITIGDKIPKNLAVFGGPVARIMLNGSGESAAESIRKSLECNDTRYRTYLREDMPRRTHYMINPRIGDVILDGDAGVEIFEKAPDFMKKGDHGYDNRLDTMHALFLAWGPSYKQNYTVAPFQNIELYNMFADTLRLERRASNNGTLGRLDEIFVNRPERKEASNEGDRVPTCPKSSKTCGTCNGGEIVGEPPTNPSSGIFIRSNFQTTVAPCNNQLSDSDSLFASFTGHGQCFAELCDSSMLYDFDLQLPSAVFQMVDGSHSGSTTGPAGCTTITYGEINCDKASAIENALLPAGMAMSPVNSFGNGSTDGQQPSTGSWELKSPMLSGFYGGIWRRLEEITRDYAQRFGRLMVISGPVFDYDNYALRDEKPIAERGTLKKYSLSETLVPSHYFRIIVRCIDGDWTSSTCRGGRAESLAFILPHAPQVDNCMEPRAYLRMHMSRIRDVELLTGLEFFRNAALVDGEVEKAISLRTNIAEDLW